MVDDVANNGGGAGENVDGSQGNAPANQHGSGAVPQGPAVPRSPLIGATVTPIPVGTPIVAASGEASMEQQAKRRMGETGSPMPPARDKSPMIGAAVAATRRAFEIGGGLLPPSQTQETFRRQSSPTFGRTSNGEAQGQTSGGSKFDASFMEQMREFLGVLNQLGKKGREQFKGKGENQFG